MRPLTEERLHLIQPVPGAEVDREVGTGGLGLRPCQLSQPGAHIGIAGPHLAQEDLVHLAGGGYQLGEHQAIFVRQVRQVGAKLGRREARQAGGYVIDHGGPLVGPSGRPRGRRRAR